MIMKNHEKHQSSKPFRVLRSRKGNAIAFALIISIVGAILVTSIAQYFGNLTKTVYKNNDIGALRAALNSAMDYTVNGVRNRWCFTANWSPNVVCKLTDANNVERMLLSDEALRAIQVSMTADSYGGDISQVRTKSIKGTVRWGDITPEHPLYYIVKGLKDIGEDFVFNFNIIRIDSGVQKGREVAMQIEVELVLGSGSLIRIVRPDKTKDHTITVVSSVLIFPREINTNALMIANNLFLDRPDPGVEGAANGNVYFHPFSSPGEAAGILFESPVFVNGNVYTPMPDAPGYTPVTFGDKVILGAGVVLEAQGDTGSFAKPGTAGGFSDRFYSQSTTFGGFRKGVLLDPGRDKGLDVLGKVDPPPAPIMTDADLCILRNAAKADLGVTRDTQLFLRVVSAVDATGTYQFVANIGAVDNFYEQGSESADQFLSKSPATLAATVSHTSPANRPIFRMTVSLNGYKENTGAFVAADMGITSTLNIQMNPSDPSAILSITTSPYVIDGNTQNNAVNITVNLINQANFSLLPYGVKVPGSTVTTSPEPRIDVNIEAFDVAYTTKTAGGIKIESGRTKGSPGNKVICPPGSPGYNTTGVVNGQTYNCWDDYAWHPAMGKYKNNGFSFRQPLASSDKSYYLHRNAASAGYAGGYHTCPDYDNALCPPIYKDIQKPQERDFVAFDKTCFTPPKGTDMFPSFGAADWAAASFTQQARRSWGFTEPGTSASEPGYNDGTLVIDKAWARLEGTPKPVFVVGAIYNKCVIRSDANFVAGFFVCDNLIIESRTEPLRIIGTFIVSKMSVADTALIAGIRWSNIFHPSAVYELRKAGILNAFDTNPPAPPAVPSSNDCDIASDPLWHPYPSIKKVQFLYKCNPISLRAKADPFQWTMIDPDCGLVGNKQQCKYRVMRYEIIELKRQEFL
jgi:hypothetical protein